MRIDCKIGSYNAELINKYNPEIKEIPLKPLWKMIPEGETRTISLPMTLLTTLQNISKDMNCTIDEAANTCAWHGNNTRVFPKIDEEYNSITLNIDKNRNLDNKIIEIALKLGVLIGRPVRRQVNLTEKEELMLSIAGSRCKNYLRITGNQIVEMV